MSVDMNTFADFATQYAQIFSTGTANIVSEGISAVSGPLTAIVVLWLIVQGILIMRGDVSARSGVTRVARVSIVVGLLSSLSSFSEYIVALFQMVLPNWAAASISEGNGVAVSAPQMFDHVWNASMAVAQSANAQLDLWDVVDGVELDMLELAIGASLLIAFAVYEIGQIMLGVVIGIGPFVLVGYLFDATRGIAERWIGKLVGLSLLTLLIAMTLQIILQGDITYLNTTVGTGALDIAQSLAILFQAALFFALGAVIIILLPSVASYIGGGISFTPAALATVVAPVTRGTASAVSSLSGRR
jgi:type IV secretion system protein VirB6